MKNTALVIVYVAICILFVTTLEPTAAHGVVSVHTGSGAWGTGVFVNDDIIVTGVHVIQSERGIK